jgi:hypothetical protein
LKWTKKHLQKNEIEKENEIEKAILRSTLSWESSQKIIKLAKKQ